MNKKYFGTDGIRGEVGQPPITPDFLMLLGWAVGKVFAKEPNATVVIGKDTRISGYMIESALEAGLCSAGANIILLGPMPSPGVAYLTRTLRCCAGIVISASHNAYQDNGIKFFSCHGEKLSDEIETAIEHEIEKGFGPFTSKELGKAQRLNDAAGRYIEFAKSSIPRRVSLSSLRCVVDCANGACYHVAPYVFRELGAHVIPLSCEPNGLNINKNCGSTDTRLLSQRVVDEGADLGIALDGDGDRLIMVDHLGERVDGDELLFITAKAQLRKGQLKGGVVGTLMSNMGLELALKELGVGFERAAVGDRYVHHKLRQKDWTLGGESSGHIINLNSTTTGDGIISALQILVEVVDSSKSLHELKSAMEKFPQTMINVRTKNGSMLKQSDAIQRSVLSIENRLKGKGRVILRASGTEPVVRVTIEGNDEVPVAAYADELASVVRLELG